MLVMSNENSVIPLDKFIVMQNQEHAKNYAEKNRFKYYTCL
jgi:hypothetical protein